MVIQRHSPTRIGVEYSAPGHNSPYTEVLIEDHVVTLVVGMAKNKSRKPPIHYTAIYKAIVAEQFLPMFMGSAHVTSLNIFVC